MKAEEQQLAQEIGEFLKNHAGKNEEGEFTSPDAYELEFVQRGLEEGERIRQPNASWESGGFRPYTDSTAKSRFTELMGKIKKVIQDQQREI